MSNTLADLHAAFDGPVPPAALAAVSARQACLRLRSRIEELTDDLDAAQMTLTRDRRIFYGAMRERRKITHALRQAKVGPVISALAFKLAQADYDLARHLKYARSAKRCVASCEGRLREAMEPMQEAAE